ncbi:MAG: thiaminase II [Candidatus Methanomethyliaceae archaeon]|nr:thiaminase II [Candidatus Methanomethyliaceae archaeon]MDW7971414.1 thiaminase II [Nitrososphaerota archaeon]
MFSQELWNSIVKIYENILNHPFIRGLVDGSLEEEKFKFYVIQDSHYLREYARALNIAAAKAPKEDWMIKFSEHAKIAIVVERALHESFFKDWNMSEDYVKNTPMSPTNLAYTTYLIATAYAGAFHELIGAILPCYWIYWEVGKELERRGSKKELYQRWINTYSSKEFAEVCKAVIEITDEVAKNLNDIQKKEMKKHFITTSKYEYMFWDSAYKLEQWPI